MNIISEALLIFSLIFFVLAAITFFISKNNDELPARLIMSFIGLGMVMGGIEFVLFPILQK